MMDRFRRLPPPLRDGTWTHCALHLVDGRIRFREPAPAARRRRRSALRRRAILALLGLLAVVLTVGSAPAGWSIWAAIGSGLCFLAALDGLAGDISGEPRQVEFAELDTRREEMSLLAPNGYKLTAPLAGIRMFLIVVDARRARYHLGVVFADNTFLPWLTTPAGPPALSLAWVFGHLAGRPAMQLHASLPFAPEEIESAEPIVPPWLAEMIRQAKGAATAG